MESGVGKGFDEYGQGSSNTILPKTVQATQTTEQDEAMKSAEEQFPTGSANVRKAKAGEERQTLAPPAE